MSWLSQLFNKTSDDAPIEWRTDQSIFNFVNINTDPSGKLNELEHDLPDEQQTDQNENQIRWAPGLLDTMFGADDSEEAAARTKGLVRLIDRIAHHGDDKAAAEFYERVTTNESVMGIIDDFLEKIVTRKMPAKPHLFRFAKDLAFHSPHRNSVKFGIAMLGLCQDSSVNHKLKILAAHDEFTIYSIVAITYLSDRLADDLWEIAKKVDGWGKIRAVTRFAELDLTDEMKDWLVLEGYVNSIMNEELAYTCAVHGELHLKLEAKSISKHLFTSSGEILRALITGGPAEDISDYDQAEQVIANYLNHAREHANDVHDFVVLTQIKDFLSELLKSDPDDRKGGWSEDAIANILLEAVSVINSRDWSFVTLEALKGDDDVSFWYGKTAAAYLNIELWPIVWKRLEDDPLNFMSWHDVINVTKPEMSEKVIRFATDNIPLKELGTGPKDSLGLGPEYLKYQVLDPIITFLENYPGRGEALILTSLNSPVTRNRNMAIKVLSKWGKTTWSKEVSLAVDKLHKIEPNTDTKGNIERLLNGLDLDF